MAQVEKMLLFLASPGDVPRERRYVQEVVDDLNRTLASQKAIVLQVVTWENDAFPGYGTDAQALINTQIAEMAKYSLFVGIMWNQLGTPTPRGASGTVEEFERAEAALEQHGQPNIWFYFRQAPAKLDTAEQLEQRKRVLEFRKRVEAKGLPWSYKSPSDFQNKFRGHMMQWLNSLNRESLSVGPLRNRRFFDETINRIVSDLERKHRASGSDLLRPREPLEALGILFDRETFRHESLLHCTYQNWTDRLHVAYQTLEILQAYQINMQARGTPKQKSLYPQLIDAVYHYCMTMARVLFETPVDEGEVKKYIGKPEFSSHLPKERKFREAGGMLQDMDPSWDKPRQKANKVMNTLSATRG
jgi:hypothetical protein